MQYTVRDVPTSLDKRLRQKAKREGKSLNTVLLETLADGVGHDLSPTKQRDLSWLAGTWVEDPAFDEVMKEFDRIDPEDWK